MAATEPRSEPPRRADGRVDYIALELLWLAGNDPTVPAFLRRLGLEPEPHLRHAVGWAGKRNRLRGGQDAPPEAGAARASLLALWGRVLLDLGGALAAPDGAADLKRLTSAAAVLKAAQGGLAALLDLEPAAPDGGLSVEGVDLDAL